MPELPEVETVRQTLRTQILNKKITNVTIAYENMIKNISISDFKKSLIGKTIIEIHRKGKYLFFQLEDCYLISHLRMEGKYFIKEANSIFSKHEHISFTLDGELELRYHDVRKFGVMEIRSYDDIFTTHPIASLGMEPLTEEFTYDKLKNVIKVKKQLKAFLLDQQFICGIGNIYADEICFESNLHPESLCLNLSDQDILNIYNATNKVIEKAVLKGGTTIRSYTSSLGVTGLFQLELKCHTRVNEPCYVCNNTIEKIRVAGRGTYICSECQKIK